MRRLVEGGASVGVVDDKGVAPVWVAASCGMLEVLQVLCEGRGLVVDAVEPGGDGKSALIMAAENGLVDYVKLLVHKGADLEAKDKVRDECCVVVTRVCVCVCVYT